MYVVALSEYRIYVSNDCAVCGVQVSQQMSTERDRLISALRQLYRDELSLCSTLQIPTDLSQVHW